MYVLWGCEGKDSESRLIDVERKRERKNYFLTIFRKTVSSIFCVQATSLTERLNKVSHKPRDEVKIKKNLRGRRV